MWPRPYHNILSATDYIALEADTLNKEISLAIDAALDKKALDLVLLDLQGISSFTDYFLICHGTSIRQTQAISDSIDLRLRAIKSHGRIEGYQPGDWICMDYGDFVVHVFTHDKREYFDLERLWGDAPRVAVEGAAEPVARRRRKTSAKSD